MGKLKHNHLIGLVQNYGQFTFSGHRSPSSEIPIYGVMTDCWNLLRECRNCDRSPGFSKEIIETTNGNTVNFRTRLQAFHRFYIRTTKPTFPELASFHVQNTSRQTLGQALHIGAAPIRIPFLYQRVTPRVCIMCKLLGRSVQWLLETWWCAFATNCYLYGQPHRVSRSSTSNSLNLRAHVCPAIWYND